MGGSILNREDYKTAIPQLSSQLNDLLENNVIINRTVITLSEGKVSDLNTYLGYFQNLTTGYFQAIAGDIEYLSSREAYINHLKTDIASFGYITAETADLRYATISNLNAAVARIGDLEADHVSVSDLTAATGRISNLEADHVSVSDLAATNADVAHLKVGDLTIGGVTVNIYDLAIAIKNSAMASGTTWYKVSASTPTAPAVFDPTADGWSQTEPAYVGGTTDHLYSCLRVVYADDDPLGTRHFQWSDVHMIQSWEAAKSAYSYAGDANTAAVSAQSSADSALKSLSEVEDVVGVLEWITAHGTMTSQAGEVFDANKAYFIVDPNGDYEVQSTKYSLVTNPVAGDINSYYCLSIDESIENYVGTHLAVTSEGLWLIPEDNATAQTSSKKILIAVGGAGHTYETAGTYIIEKVSGVDKVIAKFTADGVQIGQDGETRAEIDYHSLQLTDAENQTFFDVSDLRTKHTSSDEYGSGIYYVTSDEFVGDGSTYKFKLSHDVYNRGYTVTVDGVEVVVPLVYENYWYYVKFPTAEPPQAGAEIVVSYASRDFNLKAYTFGGRLRPSKDGEYSVAEGIDVEASGYLSCAKGEHSKARGSHSNAYGYNATATGDSSFAVGNIVQAHGDYSHAEGQGTVASGENSHAEGKSTTASGLNSHAQNNCTVAEYDNQTAIGKFNKNNSNNAFEIGNGTGDNVTRRSNAFTVDWDGNVKAQGWAGFVQMFAGATAPSGWLFCDGSEVAVADYPLLYAVIGDTYGTPSDSDHFRLPDFMGRTPVGAGQGTGLSNRTRGQKVGAETHKLTVNEMPSHRHKQVDTPWFQSNRVMSSGAYTLADVRTSNVYTEYTGGNQEHNNMQPSLGINFIICTGEIS